MPKLKLSTFTENISSIYQKKLPKTVIEATKKRITQDSLKLITKISDDQRLHIMELLRKGEKEGKSVSATASTLLKTGLDKSVFRSARVRANLIAKTELHRSRQLAARDLYKAAGIKTVKWVIVQDNKVCKICKPLGGKHFNINELGDDNLPPRHPRCRCRVLPSDFQLDIIIKKTKKDKVVETKVIPTNYKYVIKLGKSLDDQAVNELEVAGYEVFTGLPRRKRPVWVGSIKTPEEEREEKKLEDEAMKIAGTIWDRIEEKTEVLEKARPHKYIRREGTPGKYEYFYKEPPGKPTESGIKTIGVGISAQFAKTGYIDLRGQKVETPEDVAAIAQIYRNPKYETIRYIYARNGVIVGHEGRSSRIPNFAIAFKKGDRAKDLFHIQQRIARLSATEVWLVHNHPSGNPTPSEDDITLTMHLGYEIPELKGHIIVNSGKYGFIDPWNFDRTGYGIEVAPRTVVKYIATDDKMLQHYIDHPLLGKRANNKEEVANIASALKVPKGFVTVLYRSGNAVRAIQEVPVKMLDHFEATVDYIRGRMREFGGGDVVIAIGGESGITELAKQNLAKLVEVGDIIDGITYEKTGFVSESIRDSIYPVPSPKFWMGTKTKAYVTKALEKGDFSSTQVNLPLNLAKKVLGLVRLIDPEDLHPTEKQDDAPHITVRYGLLPEVPSEAVKEVLRQTRKVKATIIGVDIFQPEGKDYDVMVFIVDSPDLALLNEKLKQLPNEDTYPFYQPHSTIAYLKRGLGEKYKNLVTGLEGVTIEFDTLEFSDIDRNKTNIDLEKSRSHKYIRRLGAPGSYEYVYDKPSDVWKEGEINIAPKGKMFRIYRGDAARIDPNTGKLLGFRWKEGGILYTSRPTSFSTSKKVAEEFAHGISEHYGEDYTPVLVTALAKKLKVSGFWGLEQEVYPLRGRSKVKSIEILGNKTNLQKARSHKYIRREGTPGGYTYFYDEPVVTVGGIKFIPAKRAAKEQVVFVDVKKFDEAWKKDPSLYVGPGGSGEMRGRIQGFKDWMKDNPGVPIEMPEVSTREDGSVGFTNGRHRFAVLRDMGLETIPVTGGKGVYLKRLKELFETRTTKPDHSERVAYHWTSKAGAKSILKEGFKPGLGLHAVFGKAVYLGTKKDAIVSATKDVQLKVRLSSDTKLNTEFNEKGFGGYDKLTELKKRIWPQDLSDYFMDKGFDGLDLSEFSHEPQLVVYNLNKIKIEEIFKAADSTLEKKGFIKIQEATLTPGGLLPSRYESDFEKARSYGRFRYGKYEHVKGWPGKPKLAGYSPVDKIHRYLLDPTQPEIEKALNIASDVSAAGGKALFVGGSVRDALLGRKSKDIDIEIYNVSPEKLALILSKHGKVDQVGKSFGVFKVSSPGVDTIDVSIPRRDSKAGRGHRGFLVEHDPTMSYKEAAERRDLTINALAYNPIEHKIIDEYNGLQDLKDRKLRATNPETFVDDSLRVLRVMRFAAQLGFTPDLNLVKLCRSMDLTDLPKERIFGELEGMLLKSKSPSIGLKLIPLLGIDKILPELDALRDTIQDPKYHPEGTVFSHTLMAVDEAAKMRDRLPDTKEQLIFMLGVLLHDLGKPETTEEKEGKIISHGHDEEGAKLTLDFLGRLTDEQYILEKVESLVRNHMRPTAFYNDQVLDSAIRRLAKKVDIPMLIMVSTADKAGRGLPEIDLKAERWLMNKFQGLGLEHPEALDPKVKGRHLIPLGVKPGPAMGQILDKIYNSQLEGAFQTTEEGVEYAKKQGWLSEVSKSETVGGVFEDLEKSSKVRLFIPKSKARELIKKIRSIGVRKMPCKVGGEIYWAKSTPEGIIVEKPVEKWDAVLLKSGLSGTVTAVGKDGVIARDDEGNKYQILNKNVRILKGI